MPFSDWNFNPQQQPPPPQNPMASAGGLFGGMSGGIQQLPMNNFSGGFGGNMSGMQPPGGPASSMPSLYDPSQGGQNFAPYPSGGGFGGMGGDQPTPMPKPFGQPQQSTGRGWDAPPPQYGAPPPQRVDTFDQMFGNMGIGQGGGMGQSPPMGMGQPQQRVDTFDDMWRNMGVGQQPQQQPQQRVDSFQDMWRNMGIGQQPQQQPQRTGGLFGMPGRRGQNPMMEMWGQNGFVQ